MGLWSREHAVTLIPAIGVMVLLGILCRFVLCKREEKTRMIPLQVIAVLLVLLEIGKQALSLRQGYDLYHLPFHYCSIYIFAVPVMAFYRGKHKTVVRETVFGLCAALFLIMLIYPELIYGSGSIKAFFSSYFSFHTVVFHNLVMLALVLMIGLNVPAPTTKAAVKPLSLFLLAFCAVSAAMAQLLKTNYANFYSCNVPPLEALRVSMKGVLGYGLTQFIYVLAVTAVTVLFTLMFYGIFRFVRKLVAGKIPAKV